MKRIFWYTILVLLTGTISQSCQENKVKRECVLDNIVHLEDSIYYHIDSLPMLCKELGMQGLLIDIGDCRLYCEIKGKGVPMVVINGGPGGSHHCFHPWFSEAEKFCQVVYYDQRGCGQSDWIEGEGYSFRQAIDDLEKLRQKLNIDKWVVCGFSYGGALAQYYTASYSENVAGMVLIGAKPLIDNLPGGSRQNMFLSQEEQQKIKEIYTLANEGVLNDFLWSYNKNLNGDWKRQNFYKPTKEQLIRAALYESIYDSKFKQKVGHNSNQYNFQHVFTGNPIPTLICEGRWDLTWVAEKAEVFGQSHPNEQLVLFENAGHAIFSEDPDLFFSTLKSFIKSLKPLREDDITTWKEHAQKLIAPQEAFFKNEAHFFSIIENEGMQKAWEHYLAFRKENGSDRLFSENGMNSMGYVYQNVGDYDTAIEIFRLNLKEYPESYLIYLNLGDVYFDKGDKPTARGYYEKALELNPNSSWVAEAIEKLNNENS